MSPKPTCHLIRPESSYEGKQGPIARTDPNEQESVVLLPELDALVA